MKLYESIFILKDSLSEDNKNEIVDKIKNAISKKGGEIINLEEWGKRRLVYEIKKESHGIYYLLRYNGTPEILKNIDRIFKLQENVLRYFTTKVKKEEQTQEISDKSKELIENKEA